MQLLPSIVARIDCYYIIYSYKRLQVIFPSMVNIEKGTPYDLLTPWLGYGLLTSTGKNSIIFLYLCLKFHNKNIMEFSWFHYTRRNCYSKNYYKILQYWAMAKFCNNFYYNIFSIYSFKMRL